MSQPSVSQPSGGQHGPARPVRLTPRWGLSAHARRLLTVGLAGLIIAVVTRRAEFAGAAAPALLLLTGWRRDRRPTQVEATIRGRSARVFEEEPLSVEVLITGHGEHQPELVVHPHESVEPGPMPVLARPVPAGPKPAAASGPAGSASTGSAPAGPGEHATARAVLPLTVSRWGRRPLGMCEVILRDRWRLSEGRAVLALPRVDCYPEPAEQRTRVLLSKLPNRLGEHPARTSGEGVEFGGVREYVPGDRQRRINWPATTRRGGRLQVNTFAAERSQDVLLLVDASCDAGERGSTPLDLALRAAVAAARAYLAASDRVGLITYQWGVRWLAPGHGERHFLRIAEAILSGPPSGSRESRLDRLPRAALPPGALVLAFSPLLDQRFVETLRDLRERGHVVLVIDVLNNEPAAGRGNLARLGRRFWRMEQQAIRFSLHELGIGVIHWDGTASLDLPLAPYTRRPLASRPRN
ncbi:MAG TPA: DUF58 domain-containing protein [Streptosporangiaceae bacterium]|jgi:uncharacterized protein (DUF58 family)